MNASKQFQDKNVRVELIKKAFKKSLQIKKMIMVLKSHSWQIFKKRSPTYLAFEI
jgi:hypothetical protein